MPSKKVDGKYYRHEVQPVRLRVVHADIKPQMLLEQGMQVSVLGQAQG